MPESRFQLAGGDRNVGTVYRPEERPASVPVLIVCLGGDSPATVSLHGRTLRPRHECRIGGGHLRFLQLGGDRW
jgi:hypothetical protein